MIIKCTNTNCNKEYKKGKNSLGIYCSNLCQQEVQYNKRIIDWKNGLLAGYVGQTKQLAIWLRKYMLEKHNYSCQECGWNKRHPIDKNPLVEVDHIDGDAENCKEENLKVLCPNCHSETPTFRARNKNSSRNRQATLTQMASVADL